MNEALTPLAEIAVDESPTRWDLAPMPALVDHIITHYHRPLRESLPNLVAMARKVETHHGDRVSCPVGLAAMLEHVHRSVLDHLEKEEAIVFPAIVGRTGARLSAPVYVMELEHEHHKSDLLRIRALTGDLTPPADACPIWRALYVGLQQLEQELLEHFDLENTILFRRALAS